MYLGKVIGSSWGAKQADELEGLKILHVRPVELTVDDETSPSIQSVTEKDCALKNEVILAADTLGAGVGEYVLVATGSRVRDIAYGSKAPIKALVVAIVDGADINVGDVH